MNTPDSEREVCDQCGAPMERQLQDGFCSRCIARFSLLEREEEEGVEISGENSGQKSEVGGQGPAGGGQTLKSRFGDYELLEEIAHGGMGVVYRARQISLKRIVAVKMLLFGQFAGKKAFDRFRAEAETTARLQHPNIVAIHGIGETEGQPYFSMDYVAGRNLAELVRDRPLPARRAAGYVRKIALAVHYAHSQGVLHRDLKPANVLIDASEEPRVTDFGLARRLVGDSELTLSGQVIGSPNFMPPEQGAGKKAKVGPASDVYGLGALLYYLLTARPPFVAETFEATLAQVLNTEPVPPRQLNPSLPLDLETICLKCLEKDPARRYGSAADVADELDRFLTGEPIHARPLGAVGKGWRWCRRNPRVAAMTSAVVALLVTVTVVSLTGAKRIAEEAKRTTAEASRAEQKAEELRANLYAADMVVVEQALEAGNLRLARDRLRAYVPKPGETDLRGFEWRLFWQRTKGDEIGTLADGLEGLVYCLVFSPDSSMLAAAIEARPRFEIQLFDFKAKKLLARWSAHEQPIRSLAFTPNGLRLASGSDDGLVKLWDVSNTSSPQLVTSVEGMAGRIAFSPACDKAVVGTGGRWDGVRNGLAKVWDASFRGVIKELPESGDRVAFNPRGDMLATGDFNQRITVWDTSTWAPVSYLTNAGDVLALRFLPDGRRIGFTTRSGRILVWDHRSQGLSEFLGHNCIALNLAFSPDGTNMVTAGWDHQVRVWDVASGNQVSVLRGHRREVGTVAYPFRGECFATGAGDGTIRLWRVSRPQELGEIRFVHQWETLPVLSQDCRHIAVRAETNRIAVWNLESWQLVNSIEVVGWPLAVSPGGSVVKCLTYDSASRQLALQTRELSPGEISRSLFLEGSVEPFTSPRMSPDGRHIACRTAGKIRIWDAISGQEIKTTSDYDLVLGRHLEFSGNGQWLLSAGYNDTTIMACDLATGANRVFLKTRHPDLMNAFGFSPDKRLLATHSPIDNTTVWDLEPRIKSRGTLPAGDHKVSVESFSFSPDGKTMASASSDYTLKLWNLATLRNVTTFHFSAPVLFVEFTSDGRRLIAYTHQHGDAKAQLHVWCAPSLDEIEAAEKAESPLR